MKVIDVVKNLELEILSGEKGLDNEVIGGYVSDLLSDVMGNAKVGDVWITIQTHPNIVAVASLKEVAAVVLVNGLKPAEETIARSNSENIPLLGTGLSAFELSGRLYNFLAATK
jgi:serine kinase of HPr protein (carbohydrate metabolism regulator)